MFGGSLCFGVGLGIGRRIFIYLWQFILLKNTMKHTFIILFCWLIGSSVWAQKEEKQGDDVVNIHMEGKRGNGDTVVISFDRRGKYLFFGYDVQQEGDKALKIRGRDYVDRILSCENCTKIVSFSQEENKMNSMKCLKEIVLTAPLSEKHISMTETRKGKLGLTLKAMLYPKVAFFLKINEEMINLPSQTGLPHFQMEDTLRIVAVADGKELNIEKYAIVGSSMGDYNWHLGNLITMDQKERLLRNRSRNTSIVVVLLDEDGFGWNRGTDLW